MVLFQSAFWVFFILFDMLCYSVKDRLDIIREMVEHVI